MPCRAAFNDFAVHSQKFLLLPQRLKFAFEVVQAVQHGHDLGVRLSGPNGVGKSGTLLLAHLLCTALRLPAAYIPRSSALVNAAREHGGGDAYILETLWQQNADLIIEKPTLRRVFVAALQDAEQPFTPAVMKQLRVAVGQSSDLPGLAIIMDEVQHISREVQASKIPSPSHSLTAGLYFATQWYDWNNENSVFQLMSAASAHAHRDTKLPDGEYHRLRIMEPLDPADRKALQAAPASPAYVYDASACEFVVRIAGNVLRKLVACAQMLPHDRAPTKRELRTLWESMFDDMVNDCKRWLDSLQESERATAASQVMSLLRGDVTWSGAQVLYDEGIVFRTGTSKFVQPISAAAAAVILRATSSYWNVTRKRISSLLNGQERGIELERQVLAALDCSVLRGGAPCKLLDGTPGPRLGDLSCSYSLPFYDLNEVVAQDVPVLYRPIDTNYTCDAILMPAAGVGGVVHVVECSVTDPTTANRIDKVGKYFRPGGVVKQLQARGHDVVVVLFFDSELPVRQRLSDDAMAVSGGTAPPPNPAADSLPDYEAQAAAAALPSATSIKNKGRGGRRKKSLMLGVDGLGAVVRVVDAPFLLVPLGLLV